jgi:hypothetical protein
MKIPKCNTTVLCNVHAEASGGAADTEKVRVVREWLDAGHADRLLLCAEVAMKTCYEHYGGWGYSHV